MLDCVGCNGFKLAFQGGADPETGEYASLFNPRVEHWEQHFSWDDEGTRILGLTPIGRATVARLHMNRALMVEARRLWVQAGWHPPRQRTD